MEDITLVIDSVLNFILEVKENDAVVSFRHSKQKEIVMVNKKKIYIFLQIKLLCF